MGSVLGSHVYRRRSVAGADNADGHGIQFGKAEKQRKSDGQKYTKLSGRAEEKYLGVLKEGAKIRHGTDANKN